MTWCANVPPMTDLPGGPRHVPLELLTVDEVATLWSVSTKTVRRLMAAGELPTVRVGRSVRVRRADAADFLDAHLRPLTAQDTLQVGGLDPDGSGPEHHHGDTGRVDSGPSGTP